MSQPDLSICVVNWNGSVFLRGCLESLHEVGAGLTTETIVVDNASTDGSAEMVRETFPWVHLVRNDRNQGFARANNQAAVLSRGRYLLFLNNDTIVGRDNLRSLVDFLRADPGVGMVGPRLIGRSGEPQRSYRAKPTVGALLHRLTLLSWTGLFRRSYERYRRREFDANQLRSVEALLGAAVCLPREVFEQHGGWDERFPFGMEDFDLSTRVAGTHRVVYFPGAEITHFGKMSSRQNVGFAYTGVECGYARYLRKHVLGRLGVFFYKLLVTLNLPAALAFQLFRAGSRRLRQGPAEPGYPHSELTAVWHFATRGLVPFWKS